MKKLFFLVKKWPIQVLFSVSLTSSLVTLIIAMIKSKSIESYPGLASLFCISVGISVLSGITLLWKYQN